ncbi:MAG: hypothetical protein AB7I59_20545 [Geminicoccaceae bacterium]
MKSLKKVIGFGKDVGSTDNMGGNLDHLLRYFTTGTAEADIEILHDVFVLSSNIERKISPDSRQPRILVGRKGSGKTAMLSYSFKTIQKCNLNGLFITSRDLVLPELPADAAVAQLVQLIKPALITSIASAIGRDLQGFLSGPSAQLYEVAVKAGTREQDRLSAFSSLLSNLAKVIVDKDVEGALKDEKSGNAERLIRAIRANIQDKRETFFLFIDDTDQISSPEQVGHLNRIWAFLLGARDLCMSIPELRCIISLRDEVWYRLTHSPNAQRDQTDHFQPLIRRLAPSDKDILEIIERRLTKSSSQLGRGAVNSIWEQFFEGSSPRMPGSDVRSSWADLIVGRSRGRPRDAIQLVHYAAQKAIDVQREKIDESIFEQTMRKFSEEKVTQLGQELYDECPHVKEVIGLFAEFESDQGAFKYSAQKARHYIGRMPSYFGITLYGTRVRPNVEADILRLWNFLFLNGILNARISDPGQKDGYRFIALEEDPMLVGDPRWKDVERCIWEIHPAYRDFILQRQRQVGTKAGLPPTRRKRKRRRR